MLGAARLDVHTFEEVEDDHSATGQAVLVVIIVSIAAAIGGLATADNLVVGLIFGVVRGLGGWALWSWCAGDTPGHQDLCLHVPLPG